MEQIRKYRQKMVTASTRLRTFHQEFDEILGGLIQSMERLAGEQLKSKPDLDRISEARQRIGAELAIIEQSMQRLYAADAGQREALTGIGSAAGHMLEGGDRLLDQVHDVAELATLANYPEYAAAGSEPFWIELLEIVDLPVLEAAAERVPLERLNQVTKLLAAVLVERRKRLGE